MSILDQVLEEEYDRLNRMREALELEIKELPAGYISKKDIKGKKYFYLQKRHGGKILSTYIPEVQVGDFQKKIERRRMMEKRMKEVDKSLQKIKRVVKK